MSNSALIHIPDLLGFPEPYRELRPVQADALEVLLRNPSGRRVMAMCLPTGVGKTILALCYAALSPGRTAILMGTKGLQDQYLSAARGLFPPGVLDLADMRGMVSYSCPVLARGTTPAVYATADCGPCHDGDPCGLQQAGCPYYDAIRRAFRAKAVVTSYAYWIAVNRMGENPLGVFDTLICDEADSAFDHLGSAETLDFTYGYVRPLLGAAAWGALPGGCDLERLASWAHSTALPALSSTRGGKSRQRRLLREDLARLAGIGGETHNWALEWRESGPVVHPVWPGARAGQFLFTETPRVALMSGTLSRQSVAMLRLGEGDVDFREYPSPVPVANRRLVHLETCDMSASRADYALWAGRIDQILAPRRDRKTLIHTTSYERARQLLGRSSLAAAMMTHQPGAAAIAAAVRAFQSAGPGAVLVSPALGRGYDFPGDLCRCAIIGKVGWADGRHPVQQARRRLDRGYAVYEAAQSLVQEAGRPVRSAEDWSEIFVVDDAFRWFWKSAGGMVPGYFRDAVAAGGSRWDVPAPPPLR